MLKQLTINYRNLHNEFMIEQECCRYQKFKHFKNYF